MNPLISIVMPTFNNADFIGETLNSVINQTYQNWECIIVDDGSTDNSELIIQQYCNRDSRFKYFKRPENKIKGPSSSRNFGIEKANTDFIVFLDADDLITKECLGNRILFAQQNANYDFWIFKTKIFKDFSNDENKIFNIVLDEYNDESYLKVFLNGNFPFCISGPLWRTEKLKLINGFDETLQIFEDPDLHIRAFNNNLKSITAVNYNFDHLYRVNLENKIKKNLILSKKISHSGFVFFSKFLNIYKNQIKEYSLKFYKNEILVNGNISNAIKFYKLYNKHQILNFKQLIFIPFLIALKIFNIENRKGFGFYTFSNFIIN